MDYRREIDGLRALAVIPVILYHAGFAWFGGGFVGVDIFFVISGYLITSIILAEKEAGIFSILTFYERRARRILPALFLVMGVCVLLAWLFLLPDEMKAFSQSVVAVSIFASNIFFWNSIGYFDIAAELKPLLHTWSLAVEEQYYVLFPLFITCTWTLGKLRIVGLLVILSLASFFFAEWGAYNHPTATFFLLPTRGWELVMGCFIAFYFTQRRKAEIGNTAKQLLSGLGALLIFYAVFAFSKSTPFPSFYALVPTVGAALIILFATPKTMVGSLLSSRVFVAIGLISYSAYLWHYPFFAFARLRSSTEPSLDVFVLLIVITFLLAYISWRFIERPFRDRLLVSRRAIFSISLFGAVFFILFGFVGYLSDGFVKSRFNLEELNRLNSFTRSQIRPCEFDQCDLEHARSQDWILIGDSNAYHFSKILKEILDKKGLRLFNLAKGGCFPVLGYERKDQKDVFNQECNAHYAMIREYVLHQSSPKNIVISAAWGSYVYGSKYPDAEGFAPHKASEIYPIGRSSNSEEERQSLILESLRKEVTAFSDTGKNIILIYPMPLLRGDVPLNKERLKTIEPYPYEVFQRQHQSLILLFNELSKLPNVTTYRPDLVLCPQTEPRLCLSDFAGYSLYGDRTHLSDFGARQVFAPFFNATVNKAGEVRNQSDKKEE